VEDDAAGNICLALQMLLAKSWDVVYVNKRGSHMQDDDN
jgi:hypothetical protein